VKSHAIDGTNPHANKTQILITSRFCVWLQVDWSRFHLQLLFVDQDDMANARVAQSLFDIVTEWNGYGRALYGWTCGVEAEQYPLERTVSLMVQAEQWQTSRTRFADVFTRKPEQLDVHDMYTYDVIVAMNTSVKKNVLQMFEPDLNEAWDNEGDREFYRQRICTLGEFLGYASPELVRKSGGSALLPSQLSEKLAHADLQQLSGVADIPSAELQSTEQWDEMVMCILLAITGLVKYLIDSYPDDLHQFWLE
jgi:protein-tyrosine-phosphatase